jgi:metallophosphoesterase superfamily enzyme
MPSLPALISVLCMLGASLVHSKTDAGSGAPSSVSNVSWFVQVSDLHLSINQARDESWFGDKLGDLRLLADLVLEGVRPASVLLTGDLVDSKAPSGRPRQQLQEWKDYRSVVEHFKVATGLPETDFLDIRGNHDGYDTPVSCRPPECHSAGHHPPTYATRALPSQTQGIARN